MLTVLMAVSYSPVLQIPLLPNSNINLQMSNDKFCPFKSVNSFLKNVHGCGWAGNQNNCIYVIYYLGRF